MRHSRSADDLKNNQKPAGWSEAFDVIKLIWPYLWQFRARLGFALLLLILAKVATVTMPWVLKQIVDGLDQAQNPILVVPIMLIIAYGLLRFGSVFFAEARDAIFSRITERAMRSMVLKVFQHLHSLELEFHLSRQTGGISRDIDRGGNGFSFLMRMLVFNIVPTLIVDTKPPIHILCYIFTLRNSCFTIVLYVPHLK